MDCAEGSGKTLEEAQQAALAELGATADEVQFEILERPGPLTGLFRRQQEYRVRASRTPMTGESEAQEPSAAVEEIAISGDEQSAEVAEQMPHQELAEAGRDLLSRIITLMGVEGEVRIEECTDEEVRLNVVGDDVGLLIGRHGVTLDALQLVVAIGANREANEGVRVIVDAEDYRARHKDMIESKAQKLAAEAKATGREIVVPDLKAYERRLMHLALEDDPEVETYSEGTGDDRVLVISPV
ncbi:MAG: KH domain-containing protein [candidate division WS1 bacterium]|jgi:spoIIIJ-associated protein|nr:KH domain-containing protein [candidate division WS1 bacterium]